MSTPTMTIPMPKLTPAQLAALFWEMDSNEQGVFFDEIGTLVLSTPAPFTRNIGSMFGLDMQMCRAAEDATALGRDVMERIGQHGLRYFTPTTEDTQRLLAGHPTQ